MKLITRSTLRALALLGTVLLAAFGRAIDYEIERNQAFTGIFSHVLVSDAVNAYVVGSSSAGNLRIARLGVTSGSDSTSAFSSLGGPVTILSAKMVDADHLLVAGSIRISSDDRMFVAKVGFSTISVDWSIIEPPRSNPTRARDVLVLGSQTYVAANLQGQSAVIAYNTSTGVELWRSSVTATRDGRCQLSHFKDLRIYFGATIDAGASTAGFVRALDANGQLLWNRQLSTPFVDQLRANKQGTFVFALGQNAAISTGFKVTRLNGNTGVIQGTQTRTSQFNITPPLMEFGVNRILVRFAEIDQAATPNNRIAWAAADDLSAQAEEVRSPRGTDLASCAGEDFAPHFVGRVDNPAGGFIGEVSRESATLAQTFTGFAEFSQVSANPTHVFASSFNPLDQKTTILKLGPRPQAQNDFFERIAGTFTINAPGVTGNDFGAGGATVTLVSQGTKGTATLNSDGSFTYAPDKKFFGDDHFTYRLTRGSLTSTAEVTVRLQPHANGLLLSATQVKGGVSVIARVLLEGPRQVTSQQISMFENTTATALSSNFATVLPGESQSLPLTVFTAPVRSFVTSVITGSDGSDSVDVIGFLKVDPGLIVSLTPTQTTIVGGVPAEFTITLDSISPSNGMPFQIVDNSTAIQVPTNFLLPPSQLTGTFTAPTAVVTSSKTATITASSNGQARSTTVAIVGASLALSPSSFVGGANSTGTITLTSNPVVNSVVFALTDDSPSTNFAGNPQAIVPVGFLTGTFTISSFPVTANRTITITATNANFTMSKTLTLLPPSVATLTLTPISVTGGGAFAGLAQLNGKAHPNGQSVALSTGAPGIVQVPSSVTVTGGQDTGLFLGLTSAVTSSTMVVVSASANGVTKTATIVVNP